VIPQSARRLSGVWHIWTETPRPQWPQICFSRDKILQFLFFYVSDGASFVLCLALTSVYWPPSSSFSGSFYCQGACGMEEHELHADMCVLFINPGQPSPSAVRSNAFIGRYPRPRAPPPPKISLLNFEYQCTDETDGNCVVTKKLQ
jgi:hypothetical protein